MVQLRGVRMLETGLTLFVLKCRPCNVFRRKVPSVIILNPRLTLLTFAPLPSTSSSCFCSLKQKIQIEYIVLDYPTTFARVTAWQGK